MTKDSAARFECTFACRLQLLITSSEFYLSRFLWIYYEKRRKQTQSHIDGQSAQDHNTFVIASQTCTKAISVSTVIKVTVLHKLGANKTLSLQYICDL